MTKFFSYFIVLFVSLSVAFVTVASASPAFKINASHQPISTESNEETPDCNNNCELELETEYFSVGFHVSLSVPYKITQTNFFIVHQKFDDNFIEIQKPPLV